MRGRIHCQEGGTFAADRTYVPIPASILVYGRDLKLLQTRCMLLQMTGSKVLSAGVLTEAQQLLTEEHPDLLILCHTVSPDDASRLLSAPGTMSLRTRTVVLTAGGKKSSGFSGSEAVDVLDGPGVLLDRVTELLGQPALASF